MILLPLIPSQTGIKYINYIPDLILGLIILAFLISSLADSKSRRDFEAHIKDFFTDLMGIFFTMLFIIMAISVSYATDKGLALSESLRFLTYIILYFIVKYSIKDKMNIKGIMNSYIFIVALISIMGLIQFITGIGLDPKFIIWGNNTAQYRIAVTLENPNNLGVFLVIGLFPIAMLMLKEKNRKKKFFYVAIILLILFDVFATYSRNALIGLLICSAALAFLYSWKIFIALGGVGALILLIPQISHRFVTALSVSQNSDRVKLWETALKMFEEHPFTGVGNGNYIVLYDTYVNKYPELRYLDYSHFPSHNSYLKVLSELGIIGLAAFLGLIISSFLKLKKLLNITEDAYYKAFFTGFLAASIGFLAMNFSDNMFFIPNTTTYFWIFIALADNLIYQYKIQ